MKAFIYKPEHLLRQPRLSSTLKMISLIIIIVRNISPSLIWSLECWTAWTYFRLLVLTNLMLQFVLLFFCFFQCVGNFSIDSLSAAQFFLQTKSNLEVTWENYNLLKYHFAILCWNYSAFLLPTRFKSPSHLTKR